MKIGLGPSVVAAALSILAVLAVAAEPAAAEERRCRAGVAEVRAGGRVVWCAPGAGIEVVTDVVWSSTRHAIAFATENRRRAITLVVVLVGDDLDGHTMTWPIPNDVRESSYRGAPAVTWLGKHRVGFGYSEVRPALVASWTVRRG